MNFSNCRLLAQLGEQSAFFVEKVAGSNPAQFLDRIYVLS